tara:strand:- start:10829 stop:13417 length:2589 start_codon:yes stop_codon:yes gene_type:complete
MKNRTKNNIHKSKGKLTKVKQIKKNNRRLRGGVESDSPRTKSIKKIQATARGRSTRQTKKATTFNKLLESGAAKYKKAIPTLDLKGINLKGMVLSKRVLNGIDLQKVDLTKATLNGTKLIGANLSGSIFEQVTMKKSDLTNSICKKCIFKGADLNLSDFGNSNLEGSVFELTTAFGTNFENANLKGCVFLRPSFGYDGKPMKATNFKGANLDNCKTTTMQIFENKYLNNTEMVTFENIKFDPENYGSISAALSNITFKNSKFKDLQLVLMYRGARNKITKITFDTCVLTDFIGHSADYSEVIFENCKMEKSDLRYCNIKLCNFENNNLKDTNFSGSIFENTRKINNNDMTKSIFTNVKGLSGTLFVANNFTSCSFNGTNLNSTTFKDCNLQGCQFIPILPAGARDFESIPSDLTNTVFDNCKLQSITFQSTIGLTRRNFEGQDLRRCTFSGCDLTGTIFRDCNLSECVFTNAFITDTDFTGSNRENTVFDGAIGREQNETLTNAERGIVVEGDDEIPAIYPTDVHAAFKIVKKNNYYDTISSYVNNWQTVKDSDIVRSSDAFVRWINTFLDNVINNTTENKDVLMNYKNRCMRERLNIYNYKDNIVGGSNPRISWLLFLYATLLYVEQQISEFKELYVTDVIIESATTYGEGGLSCDRGINERFIIKLRNTMYMMMDLPQIKNDIDKVIEFNKILNVIDPTKTLPTTKDAIEAERAGPEREYIDFTVGQELRDEWYEIHGAEGIDPFDDDTTIDEAMSSYKIFLKDKFKYVNLDNEDKQRFDKEMSDEINKMRELLDEGAGMTYLFLGGRKMRGGHGGHGMWGMGGAKFRLLCRKIFGKTKCKKIRNTKKLKKLKRKGTRKY